MTNKIVLTLAIIFGIMGFLCLCLGYIAHDNTCHFVAVLGGLGISEKHLIYLGERTEALFTLTGLLVVFAAFMTQHAALLIQKEEMNRHARIFENQLFSHNFQLLINGYNNMRHRIEFFANRSQCNKYSVSEGEYFEDEDSGHHSPLMTIFDEKAHKVMHFFNDIESANGEVDHRNNIVLDTYQSLAHLAAPYISSIFNAFDTIDKSSLTDQEKQFYSSLFKSQLSVSELVFLYHVPLFTSKTADYKRLVRQFNIFENLYNFPNAGAFSEERLNSLQPEQEWF